MNQILFSLFFLFSLLTENNLYSQSITPHALNNGGGYESPMRLVKTLELFATHFGADRQASVSRELTKIYEENISDTLANLITHFSSKQVKGEIVIVVDGKQ